jgi:general secretion pathway protein K
MSDAQAKFNVMNVVDRTVDPPVPDKDWGPLLRDLCLRLNVADANADLIIKGLVAALSVNSSNPAPNPPLLPARVEQLVWLGVDPVALKRLEPHLQIILDKNGEPVRTLPNVNTASVEVLGAVMELDFSTAQRLIQKRPFQDTADVPKAAPTMSAPARARFVIKSDYFEVLGRMRLEDRVLEQKALVHRVNRSTVDVLTRDDISLQETVK